MPVESKVSRVLSDRVVAFAAGSLDGVTVGDVATVYRTFDLSNPDTADSLGTARLTLVRLRIFEVEERFSLGRTYDPLPTNSNSLTALVGGRSEIVKVGPASDKGGKSLFTTPSSDQGTVLLSPGDHVTITSPAS